MTTPAQDVERFARLLIWIGGVASTAAGAWITSWGTSKIRVYHDNRKAHLEDIKQRVLVPIRAAFDENFRSIIFGQRPVVFTLQGAREFFKEATVTEEQTELGEFLAAAFPGHSVFGAADSALLQDARKNHFRELMRRSDTFVSQWVQYAGECHAWAAGMSQTILNYSGLETFPSRQPGPGAQFYVMHNRLAVFVFKRLFGMSAPALRIEAIGSHWGLHGETVTLAFGETQQQMENLVHVLNNLVASEADRARSLRQKLDKLNESYNALIAELDLAIASRRLRKGCDLVPFF